MRRMRFSLAIGAALLLLIPAGCSNKLSRQTGLTDADLLARGEKRAEQKKYGDAAEAFQALLERFPSSPLAARAEFGLAPLRMANKQEIEAGGAVGAFPRASPPGP